MLFILILLAVFFLVVILKSIFNFYFPPKAASIFPKNFTLTEKLISINEKGKMEHSLFIDKKSNVALLCKHSKKKLEVLKEFKLTDIKKISKFEDLNTEVAEKDFIYIRNLGLRIALKDSYVFSLNFINEDAYVRRPEYVYDMNKRLLDDHINSLKAC
ncbi:hypothetical protein [Oceanirhabdus sp. W0125-5]|uniref:hypothetical protein n=1 Tax=Oceanirhabdus sp. W0125-5 TaxID=2999116 RepID=UPI0022F3176B|nr:hypothetical protein [Oceanirhabdus sp. W0125-5]WBW99599.1 hypothetical protein OW730_12870 [Oceanirhabdus sp. W0125-5]